VDGSYSSVYADLGVGPDVSSPLASVPAGNSGGVFPHSLNQLWWMGQTAHPLDGKLQPVSLEAGWITSSLDFIEPGATTEGTGTRLFVFSTPDGYLGGCGTENRYDTWGGFVQYPGRAAAVLGVHTVKTVAYRFQYTAESYGVLFELIPFEVVDGVQQFTGEAVKVGYWPLKHYACGGSDFSHSEFHVGLEVEAVAELSDGKQTAAGTIFGAGWTATNGGPGDLAGVGGAEWQNNPPEEGWGLSINKATQAATFSGTFKCLDCIFDRTKPCVPCS